MKTKAIDATSERRVDHFMLGRYMINANLNVDVIHGESTCKPHRRWLATPLMHVVGVVAV